MMVEQSESILLHALMLLLLLQVDCWKLECLTAAAIAVLKLVLRLWSTLLTYWPLLPSGANWQVMHTVQETMHHVL